MLMFASVLVRSFAATQWRTSPGCVTPETWWLQGARVDDPMSAVLMTIANETIGYITLDYSICRLPTVTSQPVGSVMTGLQLQNTTGRHS